MKSIKVWEVGDPVFYLTSKGFIKGFVTHAAYAADQNGEKYPVTCKTREDPQGYGGHQTSSDLVFKTLKELVDFYSKKV